MFQQAADEPLSEVDNTRKCMVLSYSFLELGQSAMSQGLAWVTAAVARTHGVIDKTPGGWSALLRLFLENLLLGPEGLATAGIPVTVGGRSRLIFAALKNVLADGDGLRQALSWRGAAGLKPCFKHFNVYKKARCAQGVIRGGQRHCRCDVPGSQQEQPRRAAWPLPCIVWRCSSNSFA